MNRLPPDYHARLRRFDPELRLRWSTRRCRWLLERRARYARLSIDPTIYGFAEHDTVVQQRDGYSELGSYLPHDLPSCDRLIAYLRSQDSRRLGDQDLATLAERIADELDATHAAREERTRQTQLSDVGERLGEIWERDRWRLGSRVTVPAPAPSGRGTSPRI